MNHKPILLNVKSESKDKKTGAMKVAVVGAPGFLGTKLVQILVEKGREVICLVHPIFRNKLPDTFPAPSQVKVIFKDILHSKEGLANSLAGIETVFNCAGMQHPKKTAEIYSVNCNGVENLFLAAIEAGTKNFIHISSSSVFGSNKDKSPLSEHSPKKYYTHYTKSKIRGDELLQKHAQKGTKLVIIAPAVFYGYPPSQNLKELLLLLQAGKPVPLIGKEGCLRSYVSLNKVIEAMLAAENSELQSGEVLLVSDKNPLSTKQFYESLGKGLGVKPKIICLPIFISRIAEKIAYLSGKLDYHLRKLNVLGEFGRAHFVSPAKAEQLLGINLPESSIPGLEEMTRKLLEEQT